MVHISKNVQYGVAGALAVYIVFFTRPAPAPVVSLLSNPLAQLAVLGAIVYVGATVSLLVALVAAVAVVLSIPGREYAGKSDDKTMKKKEPSKKKVKEMMEDAPPSSAKETAKKLLDMPEISKALASVEDTPEPAGDKIESKTESGGSEKFSLPGAPF
jgi:hypothetical protein